jgi:hypothetical protein
MSECTERWLPVPGYEGFYDASSLGRIRSIRHMTSRGWRGGQILKQFTDSDGYYRVNLSRLGVVRSIPVHILVLLAFAGPPGPGQEARHGPAGKLVNAITNLSWGTKLEQAEDKRRDGTMACGERQGTARLTTADVLEIRSRAAQGEDQPSLAARFRISQPHVSRIVLRQSWAHIPDQAAASSCFSQPMI